MTALPPSTPASDYARIEAAIRYLEQHHHEPPSLAELAAAVGLSEFPLHRLFHRWAGVTPKAFLQCLTLAEAKRLLARSETLISASVEVGLSGPSRLHDLFLKLECMTPGEYKLAAEGMTIRWGVHPTPLGDGLFAVASKGLCGLSFLEPEKLEPALAEMQAEWPRARWLEEPSASRSYAEAVTVRIQGQTPAPLSVLLKGTTFQTKVWEALLRIPEGSLLSYQNLSTLAGVSGPRAVGSAVATNPVAYLIPCHRVIRSTGTLGGYRWGLPRKRALLAIEGARS